MAKIVYLSENIPVKAPILMLPEYIGAAFHFARVVLWPFEEVSDEEEKRCKQYIADVFSSSIKEAFWAFCERIILHNRMLIACPGYLEAPAVWLNPAFRDGYTNTNDLHEWFLVKRSTEPTFQDGVRQLVEGYWQYLHAPGRPIYRQYRRRLLTQREYGLVQLFDNLVLCQIMEPQYKL